MSDSARTMTSFITGLFVLLGALFFYGGVKAVNDWRENPTPLKISLAEYVRTKPKSRWLELTGCSVVYSRGVAYRRKMGGDIIDVSVPVYPSGRTAGPVQVILAVPQKIVAESGISRDGNAQTIRGMVRSGPLYTGFGSDLQAVASWKTADEYIMLDQEKEPTLGAAVGVFFMSLILFCSSARGIYILANPNLKFQVVNGRVRVQSPPPATPLAARGNSLS